MKHKHSRLGFTLIEMMIVVAVLGIVAAIAFPSYRGYVLRANRTDGQQALMAAAQDMEVFFSRNASYEGAVITAVSDEGFYTVAVKPEVVPACPVASCYVITATATGAQLADDVSGIRLDSTGLRQISLGDPTDDATYVDGWKKH